MQINQRGFTLLEVLVALAVLAIALAAIIKVASENAENARYLRDKTLAHWVAMNVLTDIQVRESWLSPGKQQGTAMMADREWFWTVTVTKTVDEELRRVDVQVYDQRDAQESLAIVTGFIGLPPVSPLPTNESQIW
ncbi:MAG: type II secretion system protein GspI [Beggiatoa sp. IS2]|nr:MAG: type II secretion system protein GspI [Beggiatoa sp. IS2]